MTDSEVIEVPQQVIGYTINGDRYLNITNRCTLQCDCCPKKQGDWMCHGQDLQLHREPTVSEMLDAVGSPLDWNYVVFSGYGEPTLRLYDMLEVSRRVHGLGGKVRLETDGLSSVFFGRDIAPDLEGNVDTLVVALRAQDGEIYEKICKPKINRAHDAVIEFIRRTKEFVPNVTVTAMADTEGVDLDACQRLAEDLEVDFISRPSPHYCC